jgi:hypothetical protein
MSDHPLDDLFHLVSVIDQNTFAVDPFDKNQVQTAKMEREAAANRLSIARARALALELRGKIDLVTYREWLDALWRETTKLLAFPPGAHYQGDPSLTVRLFTQQNAVRHALGKLLDLRAALAAISAPPENTCEAGQGGRDIAGRNQGGAGQGEGAGGSCKRRKGRGRKSLSEAEVQKRQSLIDAWKRFSDSKTGQKKDFCKDRNIKVKQLDDALAWDRGRRNRLKK